MDPGDALYMSGGDNVPSSIDMYTSTTPSTEQTMSPRGVERPSPLWAKRQAPRPIPRSRSGKTAAGQEPYRHRATKSSEIPSTNSPVLTNLPSSNSPTRHYPWMHEHSDQADKSIDIYTSFRPTTNQPTNHMTVPTQAKPASHNASNISEDLYDGPHSINYQKYEQRLIDYEQQLKRKDETIRSLEMQAAIDRKQLMTQDELWKEEERMSLRERNVQMRLDEMGRREGEVQQQEGRLRRWENQLKMEQEALACQREEVEKDRAAVDEAQFRLFNQERQAKQDSADMESQMQELKMREAKMTNWERHMNETEQDVRSRERKVEADEDTVASRCRDVERRERDVERREQEMRQQMHIQAPTFIDFERDYSRGSATLPRRVSDPSALPLSRRRCQLSDDEELARRLQEEEERSMLGTSPRQPRGQPSLSDDAAMARQLQQQLELEQIEEQHQDLRRQQELAERKAEEERKRREEIERQDRLIAEQMQREFNAGSREEHDALLARQLAEQDVDELLGQHQPVSISEVGQRDNATLPSGHLTIEEIQRNLNTSN